MPKADALPNPIDFLTGRWPGWDGAQVPDGVRPPWPKFAPDGRVLPFPGTTIVCHVPPESDTHRLLVALQADLKAAPFAEHFTYLPPASLHMTLFDLSNELRRGTPAWPKGIADTASWPEVSDVLAARLEGLNLPRFAPKATTLFGGFSLILEGADPAQERSLRNARDTLRDKTRIFRSDHESYVFHVTLAYPLRFMPQDKAEAVTAFCRSRFETYASALSAITLGPAEMCDFNDMYAFTPRLTL